MFSTAAACESPSARPRPNGAPVHPECVQATGEVARLCEDLGHIVEEAAPELDMEQAFQTMRLIWGANVGFAVRRRYEALAHEPNGAMLESLTWRLAEEGHRHTAAEYASAIQVIHRVGRAFARFFEDFDLLLTPTLARPPWPLGTIDMTTEDVDGYFETLFAHMPFTAQFNASGQPAASIPLAWSNDGLPIGVQFVGRFGEDALLLRLAGQLEGARPWAHQRPFSQA